MKTRSIVLLVMGLFALVLMLQNLGNARIGILFWDVRLPHSLTLLAFYVIGAFTGGALWSFLKKVWYQKE